MDESTTTDATKDGAAVDTSTQTADTTGEAAAANTANESTTTAKGQEAGAESGSSESSDDDGGDDNLSWLTKKGIDPDDPEVLAKVAKMYRDAEKQMHASTAKASELQKALGGEQPATAQALDIPEEILNHPVLGKLVEEVQQLRAGQTNLSMASRVNDFFSSNPDAKALEGDMAKIVTDQPVIGELVKGGHMTVDSLYDMARGRNAEVLKKQGGKEALEQLADKQQAKAVSGAATTKAVNTAKDDPFLAGFNKPY